MAYRAVPERRVRRLTATVLALLCLLVGCTYERQEPGLFTRPTAPPTAPAPTASEPTASETPAQSTLPVVGDAVWTSGDGSGVTVRWAVHAVRRMAGATVLDWSVTPLSAPALHAGDRLPPELDLGLTENGQGYDNVALLDLPARRVYRPLTRRGSVTHACLCTRTSSVGGELRIGRTTLLQTAYPELPAGLTAIDVDIATVGPFIAVPVTPVDRLPALTDPVDLARPAEEPPHAAVSDEFGFRPGGQRVIVTVEGIDASDTLTSVRWSIRPATRGRGLESVPKSSSLFLPDRVASTLSVREGRSSVPDAGPSDNASRRTRVNTQMATDRLSGPGRTRCLCTDLGRPADRPRDTQPISVVTILPPLRKGATAVDVRVPRVPSLDDVAVLTHLQPLPSATLKRYRPTSWEMPSAMPHPAWAVSDWPTPLPERGQLGDFEATVDSVVR